VREVAYRKGLWMRIDRELMRGVGPTVVMQLLERREMYGYELVEALSRHSEGLLAMGQSTLYPLLYNLEAKKLIRGKWKASAEVLLTHQEGCSLSTGSSQAVARPRRCDGGVGAARGRGAQRLSRCHGIPDEA
jgi:hypothetical protein